MPVTSVDRAPPSTWPGAVRSAGPSSGSTRWRGRRDFAGGGRAGGSRPPSAGAWAAPGSRACCDLVDEGAQSPKETWLRLLLIEAGFPRPQTQIPVLAPDGYPRYYLDMGWPEFMVAVEYDGEQHRTDTESVPR